MCFGRQESSLKKELGALKMIVLECPLEKNQECLHLVEVFF